MNSINVKNLVNSALKAVDAYGAAITGLKAEYAGRKDAEVRTDLMPHVGAYYGVKCVASAGKGNATASIKLDAEAPKYEAARKALQRLVKDIMDVQSKDAEVSVPRAVQAAFDAAWALAAKYEKAGKMAATALAAAKAK